MSRAIAVLQAINRFGPISVGDVSKICRLPYPTTNRLVLTLAHEGLVQRDEARKLYRPTAMVNSLSQGFKSQTRFITQARPIMEETTRKVLWPLVYSVRVGNSIVVRDGTHHLTSLTFHHYAPGFSQPILGCSSGLVHLAFSSNEDRATIIDGLKADKDRDDQLIMMFETGYLTNKIRADGYAMTARNAYTLNPGKTSSISLPLCYDGGLIGALTMVFFATSLTLPDAARRFLPDLQATAHAIEERWLETSPEAPLPAFAQQLGAG